MVALSKTIATKPLQQNQCKDQTCFSFINITIQLTWRLTQLAQKLIQSAPEIELVNPEMDSVNPEIDSVNPKIARLTL